MKRSFESNIEDLLFYAVKKGGYRIIYDQDIDYMVFIDYDFTYEVPYSDDLSKEEEKKREELFNQIFSKYTNELEKNGFQCYYDKAQDLYCYRKEA